jgi:threonine/homoserine/homoserine lactone efflux protein
VVDEIITMSAVAWWIFLPACIGMNFFPGPNNLIALVHGTQAGLKRALIAGLARLPVMVMMLGFLAIGLEILLATSAAAFEVLKFVGAGYLLWMAWQAFYAEIQITENRTDPCNLLRMMRSEAVVAATNPKLILIFYAFFPQFIDPEQHVGRQVGVIGGTFILIEVAAIAVYAAGGYWLQARLREPRHTKTLSYVTAGALTAAATLIVIPT